MDSSEIRRGSGGLSGRARANEERCSVCGREVRVESSQPDSESVYVFYRCIRGHTGWYKR